MIRTAEQYVESLRDGRVVYQDGERVEDVPTRYARTVERFAAEFYVATMPEHRALFTMIEDGEEVLSLSNCPKPLRTFKGVERYFWR